MNKFDRITAILIQLQSRRVVKAQDIAARFDVSLRTVYRDIRTLETAGVPIIGEAGVGYSIMSGYRLPPVMFSEDEATALLVAEKLIGSMTDPTTKAHCTAAMLKIKSVLRSAEKNKIEELDHNIAVAQQHSNEPFSYQNKVLQNIFKGIAEKKCLSIQYKAAYSEEDTTRVIEPVGIFHYSDAWHMIAYCRLRKDYRDFRVDRINQHFMTTESYASNHPTLKEYLQKIADTRALHKVVVLFRKEVVPYSRTQKYFYGYVGQKETGDYIEMTFLSPNLKGMARWLLVFTNGINIQSPTELIDEMKALTVSLQGHYL